MFILLYMRFILPFLVKQMTAPDHVHSVYTENLRSFLFLLCKNSGVFSESFILHYTNKVQKACILKYLVFSLPDSWAYKTLIYFAVKACMCAFLFFRFSLTLPTKKLEQMTFAWMSPNLMAQSQCSNATT